MGLLSIFKRKADAKPGAVAAGPSPGGVQQARTRARQRLVGAVVLVVIGVIAFPLVFESQPRPIPVDIPISIPSKDGAPALVMPPARTSLPAAVEPVASPAKTAPEAVKPDAATAPAPAPAAAPAQEPAAAPAPVEPTPAPKASAPAAAATEVPKKASAPAAAPAADAARAKALLEGKPAASKEAVKEVAKESPKEAAKEGARFVVQVGAFAEAAAAQDTRAKLEKLGLKTFTQVTETAAGNRTRVRLGPFATREEAERVLAKTKAAGVGGVVLTL
jgi:DedD protein